TGGLKLLPELFATSPRDRTTPQKAVKAYLDAIRQSRWSAAAACLSWVCKQGSPVSRLAIPELDLAQAQFRVSDERGLQRYWQDFVGMFKTRGSRKMSVKILKAQFVSQAAATVAVEARVILTLKTAHLGGEALARASLGDRLAGFVAVRMTCEWPVYQR